ncbi:unnamed protein product [Tuber melanosporum]|uniref:(Perigord truffle) hypothetical protein n=1 Tax=Tuber melanosporum (strain Mel28) TaxID=656061 RepID=D5GBR3_TUBMM|nr:uncharacterized protein GSTUM_00005536001 [Tuber melanosporum]CAZ81913.1 unnamed protein product [Tuber melanosporum]
MTGRYNEEKKRRWLCGRGGGVSEWMETEKKVCRGGIIWGEERERGEEGAGAICGSEGAYGLVRNDGGVCEPFTSMGSYVYHHRRNTANL